MLERTGALSPAARRLYQLLLLTVADEGADTATASFPGVSDVRAGGNVGDLGELVDAGLVVYDTETGLVNAVMPLVASATGTAVALDGDEQLTRRAASVVDAFALAALLDRQIRIDDTCATCSEIVMVLIDPDKIRRKEPRSAVAIRSLDGNGTIRLACSPDHAQAALDATVDAEAVMQSIEVLFIEARHRYAALID